MRWRDRLAICSFALILVVYLSSGNSGCWLTTMMNSSSLRLRAGSTWKSMLDDLVAFTSASARMLASASDGWSRALLEAGEDKIDRPPTEPYRTRLGAPLGANGAPPVGGTGRKSISFHPAPSPLTPGPSHRTIWSPREKDSRFSGRYQTDALAFGFPRKRSRKTFASNIRNSCRFATTLNLDSKIRLSFSRLPVFVAASFARLRARNAEDSAFPDLSTAPAEVRFAVSDFSTAALDLPIASFARSLAAPVFLSKDSMSDPSSLCKLSENTKTPPSAISSTPIPANTITWKVARYFFHFSPSRYSPQIPTNRAKPDTSKAISDSGGLSLRLI